MQKVLITGGTGLVGGQLTKHLTRKGYAVIILTRKLPSADHQQPGVSYAVWDINKQTIDLKAVQEADFIIHLAGAGVVDKRWTDSYKKEIVDSRTRSSALLLDSLQNNVHSVKAVVSASAIGWYGADPAPGGRTHFIESDPPASSFLGETCQLWEQGIARVTSLGIRLAKIRIGIVLSNEGGALVEFKKPIQLGIAGILGNGQQVISWIHIDDLCRIFIEAMENGEWQGSYNAVAPNPVSNKQLTLALARQLKGRFYIPLHVPPFVLKLMMGESSVEVLKSTTVSNDKVRLTGFTYGYPTIEAALHQLCNPATS